MKNIKLFKTVADATGKSMPSPAVKMVIGNDKLIEIADLGKDIMIDENGNFILPKGPVYEMVDLNLPSGLKWANMNIGATKPEDSGRYFAWGDVKGTELIWSNVKSGYVKNGDKVEGFQPFTKGEDTVYVYLFGSSPEIGIAVYEQASSSSTKLGYIKEYDNDTISFGMLNFEDKFNPSWYNTIPAHDLTTDITPDSGYDAVRVNMGSSWRLPTKDECEELLANTTQTIETINGVKGAKFTSKVEGNSSFIFVPCAGYGCNGIDNVGNLSALWTSSISDTPYAWCLCDFSSVNRAYTSNQRVYLGLPVRGVCA